MRSIKQSGNGFTRGRAFFWLLFSFITAPAFAQQKSPLKADSAVSCGQKEITEALFRQYPAIREKQRQIDLQIRTDYKKAKIVRPQTLSAPQQQISGNPGQAILAVTRTIPVVVHLIHNNGPENISDAQVMTAIQHLNEAFANTGFYDPSDGVNTNIQFCMAERDPNNNPTQGITRDVSAYTVMGGPPYYSDDQNVKNLNRWNPLCYVNIWVVKSIPGSVAGYAYLPSAHGMTMDGIVVEAGYFGSSYTNDVVITHEMGHYLGLYHTFEGGCANTDCSVDGDRICDTPPDQSTVSIACGSSMNSCSTDVLSGFATNQPDLTQDYMDYGNFNCMKVFTQEQSDRMNWTLDNVRSSLLHCKSCMAPCPSPVTAAFSNPGPTAASGSSYLFTNGSVNAGSYEWQVNGSPVSTATHLSYTFSPPGNYIVTLIARSANPLCDSAMKTFSLTAICPVFTSFTKSASTAAAGTSINFTNGSTGASVYQWSVNGVPQSSAVNYSFTTTTAGMYIISLQAMNTSASCQSSFADTVYFTCPVIADFTPASLTTLVNTPITFTSTGNGATGYQWSVNGTFTGSANSLTYTFATPGTYTVQLMATNGVCSSVKSGVVYVGDKCGNPVYQFRNNYSSGTTLIIHDMTGTSDGGSLLAGSNVVGSAPVAVFLKLDAAGNVQWSRTYANRDFSYLEKCRQTSDGGYIAIGFVSIGGAGGKLFIIKTAPDGSLSWSRELQPDGDTFGKNIIESAENDYYFTGTISRAGPGNSTTDGLVGKLDNAGNIVWLKSYDAGGIETPTSLAAEFKTIIVCGNLGIGGTNKGFLMQLNKTDGSVNWSKNYLSTAEDFKDILLAGSGYLIDVNRSSSTIVVANTDHVYLMTDLSGNITYSKYFTPFNAGNSIGYSSLFLKPDGHIVSQSSTVFGGTYQDFFVQEISPSTGIQWSKTYNEPDTYIRALGRKADNSFYLGGFSMSAGARAYQMSVDSLGNGGTCPANPANTQLLSATYNETQQSWVSKAIQAATLSDIAAQDLAVTVDKKCQYVACDSVLDTCLLCKNLKIQGQVTVCDSFTGTIFKALRDTGCHLPVSWQVDTSYVALMQTTDSTIAFRVKKTGMIQLVAKMITPCDTLMDTLIVHVYQPPGSLDLGPDIALCTQSTILLHAAAGYSEYIWQNGSADSTFTAYFPGLYWVQVTDYCGNKYSDTVHITQAPDNPFDIGADTVICRGDSLLLNATAGFASYSWSPVTYQINNPYIRNPVVHPLKDTSYTCVAFKYAGCTVVDSIHITVLQNGVDHFLDSVAALCKGSTITLTANGNWNHYLWSDGESSSSIQVTQPGNYWLQVRDLNNCTGKDTITVVESDCRTGIHFPNAFTPDGDGQNDVFRAILGEAPVTYHLLIFNRWGETVFETSDPAKGWDGLYKGSKQDSGGFVWYAYVRFATDKKEQMLKGSVILLR